MRFFSPPVDRALRSNHSPYPSSDPGSCDGAGGDRGGAGDCFSLFGYSAVVVWLKTVPVVAGWPGQWLPQWIFCDVLVRHGSPVDVGGPSVETRYCRGVNSPVLHDQIIHRGLVVPQ